MGDTRSDQVQSGVGAKVVVTAGNGASRERGERLEVTRLTQMPTQAAFDQAARAPETWQNTSWPCKNLMVGIERVNGILL